ncbi:MAG: hypothetical protein II903_05205 [Spirochaetales bacterium]|nr:hypothetical protein [Spirochaetales bacterium]
MKTRTRNAFRVALIIIAVSFILLGIFRDEASIVLNKAEAICFACIGLD